MRAITIRQPWAWAIIHAGKTIENRNRKDGLEPKAITRYRGQLAIHASAALHKREYGEAQEWMRQRIGVYAPPPGELAFGAIVGVAAAVGQVGPWSDSATLGAGASWWTGGYGLVLDRATAVKPVPCKGQLAIWAVADNVAALVAVQLATRPCDSDRNGTQSRF